MAEANFRRSGAAARKPAAAEARRKRRSRTVPVAPDTAVDVRPAKQLPTPEDEVAVRLAIALADLPEDVRKSVATYRNRAFSDDQWAEVGDLVRLGIALSRPEDYRATSNLGWALGLHARVQLAAGTSRSITGWYGHDAIGTSLAGGRFGRGADAFTLPAHFGSSFNGRLRTIGRILVPATPPPPRKYSARQPSAPLTVAEL